MAEKIIIADDEMHILHILAIKLRNAGYEVFTAGDGEEAFHICVAQTPNLIITDYQMPFLNGLELCAAYREQSGRTIPAMLITAREYDISVDDLAALGIEVVMTKPFSPREVVQVVRRLLEKQKQKNVA